MTPGTVAHQGPLYMGFFRQEYWSGLAFPSPGDLPDPGIEPGSATLKQILYHLSHLTGFYKQFSKLTRPSFIQLINYLINCIGAKVKTYSNLPRGKLGE